MPQICHTKAFEANRAMGAIDWTNNVPILNVSACVWIPKKSNKTHTVTGQLLLLLLLLLLLPLHTIGTAMFTVL